MLPDDFILDYQNGQLGCSVSTLRILRLFFVGRIHETRVLIALVSWSLGLLLLIGITIIGFLCLPALWVLLGASIILAIFALGFICQVGELIVSTALIDKHFYQFALAEGALYVLNEGEDDMAGATESIVMLFVDTRQGNAKVKLESLLEEFEISAKAIEKIQVEDDQELWLVRVMLPSRVYQALMMALAERPEINSIEH
jgi:hypothetical protein